MADLARQSIRARRQYGGALDCCAQGIALVIRAMTDMQISGERSDSAQQKQGTNVRWQAATTSTKRAIESLLPPPIAATDLVALFDGRATIGAIKGWRFGRRGMPQWAVDTLARKLREHGARFYQLASDIRPAVQYDGRRALAAWRKAKKEAGD